MPLTPGSSFGPYRVVEPLGRGGMASVHKVYEASLDRYVALKVLPAEFLHDSSFAERFQREARVIARLEHRHIVPIYGFGIDEGIPWMAMRLVSGGTLGSLLKAGRLPLLRAIQVLREAAEGLEYAHENGVLHRDIKPQNLLLDEKGHVYLADFGIAKMVADSTALTQTGTTPGTPQYMSPEQARGDTVDQRTDIYALGIVAYEMLTGRVPFTADTPVGVLMKHIMEAVPVPAPWEVPAPLARPLLKCLAKSPSDRWPAASGFVGALEAGMLEASTDVATALMPTLAIAPEPTLANRMPTEAGAMSQTARPPETQRLPPPRSGTLPGAPAQGRPVRALVLAAAVAVAAAAAWGVFGFLGRGLSPEAPPTAPGAALDNALHQPVPETPPPTTTALPSAPAETPGPSPASPPSPGALAPAATPQPTSPRRNVRDGQEYAWIPPGTFQMGCVPGDDECQPDESPRHAVTLTRGFWIGKTEVTVEAYRRKSPPPGSQGGDDHPVEDMSWDDARRFCEWGGGRLPTEAEWEYAARGGHDGLRYPWGDRPSDENANYGGTGGRDQWEGTSPVGSFAANGFGLHDTAGNVWEWVADWYDEGYYGAAPQVDPPGPASGSSRVLRGGSWNADPWSNLRSSNRHWDRPANRSFRFGFRCVRDALP